MAHFAKLDDGNIVIDVNVVNNETINNLPFPDSEPVGVAFLTEWSGGYSNWKQTSYNSAFRKNFAGIGYSYDPVLDAFVPPSPYPNWVLNTETLQWEPPVAPPQPYPSWLLNAETNQWQAPIPYPTDGKNYSWNEETQQWVEITGE